MKLVYTGIETDLTAHLVTMAQEFVAAGKRVFYIAPNSLSFEKEREILSRLPQQASFAITVTRFAQMARYLILNAQSAGQPIDEVGLTMIFYRVLIGLSEGDLKIYGKVRTDLNFISQLVALYKELQTAHLTIEDLVEMESPDKQADLALIFERVTAILVAEGFQAQTKLSQLMDALVASSFDLDLADTAIIVDGFTRFSAEEQALIGLLNDQVHEVVIGTFASKSAYQATYIEGNIYQAGVDFLRQLATTFKTKPTYISGVAEHAGFDEISKNLEAHYSFREPQPLSQVARACVTIWDVVSQKEEIEHVAQAIRKDLQEGYRYGDILLLLGDVDSYQLQIGKVFDKYEIPYYFGKAEEMSHHPLVSFVEALERLKRYQFRAEDVLNLLKSGLLGGISQVDRDKFEQYVHFADLNGWKGARGFEQPFTVNRAGKFNLDHLNQLRTQLILPLGQFLSVPAQLGRSLLKKLTRFLEAVDLPGQLQQLSAQGTVLEQEQDQQVWKHFTQILQTFDQIFGKEKLTMADFLAILRASMMSSNYRIVPATVDVVNVKSYDLVQPRSKKRVYAIGLTQSNFPKISKNTSLITDEERAQLNAGLTRGRFELASKENIKKNHAAMLSLVNSATEHLVLSRPQLFNEAEDDCSPYLKLLIEMGVPHETKHRASVSDRDLGNYKALLSRVIELNRGGLDQSLSPSDQQFWGAVVRELSRYLATEQVEIPQISDALQVTPVSAEALAIRYPKDQPLSLSASALATFYDNEYAYYLQQVLKLEEPLSIHPDARSHGTYLHRIFEKVMAQPGGDFDQKLAQAIEATNQERPFATLYGADSQSRYAQQVLLDIARATALVLRDAPLTVQAQEAQFVQEVVDQKEKRTPFLAHGRAVQIKGIIDRLDVRADDGALGVVDYKSSANQFKLDRFYHGLSPQLITYLDALQEGARLLERDEHSLVNQVKGADKATSDQHYQAEETAASAEPERIVSVNQDDQQSQSNEVAPVAQQSEATQGASANKVFGAMYLHMLDPIVKLKEAASFEEVLAKAQGELAYKGLFVAGETAELGSFYQASKASQYDPAELAVLVAYNRHLYQAAAEKILSGRFAINPYSLDGRSVAGQQLKAITRFEADLHLGQARHLQKFGRKREDWLEAMNAKLGKGGKA